MSDPLTWSESQGQIRGHCQIPRSRSKIKVKLKVISTLLKQNFINLTYLYRFPTGVEGVDNGTWFCKPNTAKSPNVLLNGSIMCL